jgi:hypothetical protein
MGVGETPFKLLNCPDPTTGDFETLTADIPLTLARLRVD